jgi:glycine cleavage system H protein
MTAILVILTILIAVGIDAVLMAVRRHRAPVRVGVALQAMLEPRPPQGIFLDSSHAWLRITTDGTLRVGVDDFLTEAIGEVEAVNPAPRGAQVKRGDPLIKLTVAGRELVIPAPAAGEVVSVNTAAVKEPWSVSRDPYGVGWVVGLWTRDHHEAIRPLRIGSAAGAFLRQEMQRLADFLTQTHAPATAPVLADGGLPGKGAVAALDEQHWSAFQTEFLATSPKE